MEVDYQPYLTTTLPRSGRDSNTGDCGTSPWSKPSHSLSAHYHHFLFRRPSKKMKKEEAKKNPDKVKNQKRTTKHRTHQQQQQQKLTVKMKILKKKREKRKRKMQNQYSQPNKKKWPANLTKVCEKLLLDFVFSLNRSFFNVIIYIKLIEAREH